MYAHDPPGSGTNIRVLELLPAEGRSLIQCRLLVVERRHAPPFDAISYAWEHVAAYQL